MSSWLYRPIQGLLGQIYRFCHGSKIVFKVMVYLYSLLIQIRSVLVLGALVWLAYPPLTQAMIFERGCSHSISELDRSSVKSSQLSVEQTAKEISRRFSKQEQYNLEVLSKIDSGSQAQVYRLKDRSTNRVYALKMLWLERGMDNSERIMQHLQEYKIINRLNHPNIIRVHAIGTQPLYGILMEHFDGEPVNFSELSLSGQRQINSALDYLAEQGISHNDVYRPGNILINKAGEVRLIDFGVASFVAKSSSEH